MNDFNSPAHSADTAAEAIRTFNHQTRSSGPDWEYPSHAYDVVGGLSMAAMMLPQALEQTNNLIADLHSAGHVKADNGLTDERVSAALEGLSDAQFAARSLYEALQRTQNALGGLAYKE
ncbi:hypothetical protein [Streptomyces sp. Da 82-17]|uniref:hypothetical protein n=1 Tax=Streptomyces sp. Da 82-17 TaxID=3377116 RepID=UPI0038D45F9D